MQTSCTLRFGEFWQLEGRSCSYLLPYCPDKMVEGGTKSTGGTNRPQMCHPVDTLMSMGSLTWNLQTCVSRGNESKSMGQMKVMCVAWLEGENKILII